MTTTFSVATEHSLSRAKERIGVKGKQAEKRIQLAAERGKSAESFTSKEREFLESRSKDGITAIAYNNFCYLMNGDGKCVTVYALPGWFGKKKCFNGKEPIRDFKKYCRNYEMWPAIAM